MVPKLEYCWSSGPWMQPPLRLPLQPLLRPPPYPPNWGRVVVAGVWGWDGRELVGLGYAGLVECTIIGMVGGMARQGGGVGGGSGEIVWYRGVMMFWLGRQWLVQKLGTCYHSDV